MEGEECEEEEVKRRVRGGMSGARVRRRGEEELG